MQDHKYPLFDGIYPVWADFVIKIFELKSGMKTQFFVAQEALRKCFESVFGVLSSHWGILTKPCMLWDRRFIRKIHHAAIILQK